MKSLYYTSKIITYQGSSYFINYSSRKDNRLATGIIREIMHSLSHIIINILKEELSK